MGCGVQRHMTFTVFRAVSPHSTESPSMERSAGLSLDNTPASSGKVPTRRQSCSRAHQQIARPMPTPAAAADGRVDGRVDGHAGDATVGRAAGQPHWLLCACGHGSRGTLLHLQASGHYRE